MIGTSNATAITEYLKARPLGATTTEIALHLNTSGDSVVQSMERLFNRGLVEKVEGSRINAVWTLIANEPTPPIFRAMETLKAMQNAARHA
jgi:hypothetical protein